MVNVNFNTSAKYNYRSNNSNCRNVNISFGNVLIKRGGRMVEIETEKLLPPTRKAMDDLYNIFMTKCKNTYDNISQEFRKITKNGKTDISMQEYIQKEAEQIAKKENLLLGKMNNKMYLEMTGKSGDHTVNVSFSKGIDPKTSKEIDVAYISESNSIRQFVLTPEEIGVEKSISNEKISNVNESAKNLIEDVIKSV